MILAQRSYCFKLQYFFFAQFWSQMYRHNLEMRTNCTESSLLMLRTLDSSLWFILWNWEKKPRPSGKHSIETLGTQQKKKSELYSCYTSLTLSCSSRKVTKRCWIMVQRKYHRDPLTLSSQPQRLVNGRLCIERRRLP